MPVAHRLVAKGSAGADAAGSLQTHLHYAGHYAAAAEVGELIYAATPRSPAQTAFEVACSWSRAGTTDAAVRWVDIAIEQGFTAGKLLDGEPDLEAAAASSPSGPWSARGSRSQLAATPGTGSPTEQIRRALLPVA